MLQNALIIGCGYLGMRVARAWRDRFAVHALTRGRADLLRSEGITPIIGDVTDPASLRALPPADVVLYAVGLDRSAGKSMRDVYVDGLTNVLRSMPTPGRFVYVSSTSVYGQTGGEVVDESSPCEPIEESGRIVLKAEQSLREHLPGAILLRFAGIYGPGRLLREKSIRAGEPIAADPEKWLNLIHVADGVSAVTHAAEAATPGSTFLISDGHPVRRRDFYGELAELLQAPAIRFESAPGDTADRRVSNAKARQELRWEPMYPTFAEGLRASLPG